VRVAASQALRSISSDEAYDALLASAKQPDARVRKQVAADILSFYRERSQVHAQDVVEHEKNPDIRAQALTALGSYHKPEVGGTLRKYLRSDSYKNVLADGAINGMRAQGDPQQVPPLMAALREGESRFTGAGFARGVETLAYLARHEKDKEDVREFLLSLVNHKKQRVQLAVLSALGTLNDPKAISVVEKFASDTVQSPERTAAEKALAALRENRPASAELGSLRKEVLDLQKENRDLRKELDDLKKKVDAVGKQTTSAPPSKPKRK